MSHSTAFMVRSASSRKTTTARASPYHPSVTLFEVEDASILSPRRSKRVKLENPLTDLEDLAQDPSITNIIKTDAEPGPSPKKRTTSASPRKARPIKQSLATPHPAPVKWREAYDAIKGMRSRMVAPVDTMGCDQAQLKEHDPKARRFATLVSLMLSSQTKDEVTDAAVSKLRDAVGGSLTIDAIIQAEDSAISDAIAKVGFWRRKTQYIKQTAQRLHDDFDNDIPKTVDELCSLPGVGPKMAFLALQIAWKLNLGIGVDVHVHRITNRLGWHRRPTKNPEETRLNLQSWLPTELHPDINHTLVGFGQMICLPVGPRCDLCDLSAQGLCPSAQKVVSSKGRKAVVLAASASGPELEISFNDKELLASPSDSFRPST